MQGEGGHYVKKWKGHIGSSLNDFLRDEGILEEAREVAIKEAIAYQIQQVMEKVKISKIELLDSLYNGNCDDSHCRHCPRCPRS
jgi:hypothetical protein